MKSPIKDKPLRNPGQSLDRYILDMVLDEGFRYFIIIVVSGVILVMNWGFYLTKTPIPPYSLTLITLAVAVFSYYKIKQIVGRVDRLKQGRDGEKVVGQYLELLREQGVKVFHDVPGDNFNLDHVLVAPSGVYVVETKTYSKPDKGDARIIYTGDSLIYHNGFKDDKPLVQVKAAANWLKQIIKESTGRDFNVREVVLFPGWFIESTAESKQSDVWVLNPKALGAFISNSGMQLSVEDVALIANRVSIHVRNADG